MKSTLAGFGGIFFLSAAEKNPEEKPVDVKGKGRKLVYRTLGRTGLKLPVINMGVMNSDNPNLIRAALDSGIVLLDTAHAYMQGRNEEVIGSVVKGRPRDSYLIGSKVSLPQDRTTGRYIEGATEAEFLKKLDLSLKRLGIDHVDILYHHNVSRRESAFHEPVLNAMAKAKKAGKFRFAGITTHTNEPEVIHAAVDTKFYEVILTAYNYQQKHVAEVRDAIARAAQAGLGIVGMKAIRGGFRQTPSVRNSAAALKWVLQDPNVHTIVPGFTTFDQLETDLAVMEESRLTDAEKKELAEGGLAPRALLPGLPGVPRTVRRAASHPRSDAGLHVRVRLPESRHGPGSRPLPGASLRGLRGVHPLPGEMFHRISPSGRKSGISSGSGRSPRSLLLDGRSPASARPVRGRG